MLLPEAVENREGGVEAVEAGLLIAFQVVILLGGCGCGVGEAFRLGVVLWSIVWCLLGVAGRGEK